MPETPDATRQYLMIGAGRLARHLLHYLSLVQAARPELALRYPVIQWSRESADAARLEERAARSDVVLLAIRDAAIESFVREHQFLAGRLLVHFSGALSTPLATGLHPLMTFGPELYELALYESIPFIGDQGRESFGQVFPFLPNPSFSIPADERPFYHALCVLSGNFTVLLWQKLIHELRERYGISQEAAWPYLSQIATNVIRDPESALTGPLPRRDLETIARNLHALEGDGFRDVYQAFVTAHLGPMTAGPDADPANQPEAPRP